MCALITKAKVVELVLFLDATCACVIDAVPTVIGGVKGLVCPVGFQSCFGLIPSMSLFQNRNVYSVALDIEYM